MAAECGFVGKWLKDGHPASKHGVLEFEAPTSQGVRVTFQGKQSWMKYEAPNVVFVDWGKFGHKEWNCSSNEGAPFVFEGGVAREKKSHIWRRVPSYLSHSQIETFKKEGFLILRQAVPPNLVKRARRGIINDFRTTYNCENFAKASATSFGDGLRNNDGGLLTDLVESTLVKKVVGELVGQATGGWGKSTPQVAVRWPTDPREDFLPPSMTPPHIDGVPTKLNGVKKYSAFTALVGVAVSDQEDDYEGNFVVYPGSHKLICQRFTENLQKTGELWPQDNGALHPIKSGELGEAKQVHLKAGDAIIAHYLLAHGIAENRGADLRMNLYWRVKHKDHYLRCQKGDMNFVTDLWSGFDVVKEQCSENWSFPI